MKAKQWIAFALAVVLMLSVAATPALAADAAREQTNEAVTIQLEAKGELLYGAPLELIVKTNPEDTQYIGVVLGTSGEAKGYVTLLFSEKIRTLLKLIPLPKVMSATPDQEAEFNVYDYLKQLIDGNDVSVLLRVADEVASVMDVLKFYVPTLNDISLGLKVALELIRRYLPADIMTHIYVDEQPVDAGSYIAGAVALESGDINTAGVAMFSIKPRSEGVRLYWAEELPVTMSQEQAAAANTAAVAEIDGQVFADAKITYTYKKNGFLSDVFGEKRTELPTEPGEYTETATLVGNYTCTPITRTIYITG